MFKGKFFKGIFLPLAIGLICALISAVLLYQYVQDLQVKQLADSRVQIEPAKPKIPVVVSTQGLHPGMPLNLDDLRVRELDETSLPSDIVHPHEAELLVGRTVRADLTQAIRSGKPLQWLHLQPLAAASFASTLPPGSVPLSFSISSLQQHAGLLKPGDTIDLYANMQGNAELILERAVVMATGHITQASQEQSSGVVNTGQSLRPEAYQQITVAVPLADYFKIHQISENQMLLPILRDAKDPVRVEGLAGFSSVEIITPGSHTAVPNFSQYGGY
ncbi:Flp pilus assembly protein CpaB [Aliidiomarina iranensis]|uniref:Flp pilus assembly protein CpaB n=1 Tax=Aliidiomarina iranensis TaxID=1434071 RepID=UPI0013002C73|nr:Flp pilus assembly protein CpaB [Aliidiomarina iranensis]